MYLMIAFLQLHKIAPLALGTVPCMDEKNSYLYLANITVYVMKLCVLIIIFKQM